LSSDLGAGEPSPDKPGEAFTQDLSWAIYDACLAKPVDGLLTGFSFWGKKEEAILSEISLYKNILTKQRNKASFLKNSAPSFFYISLACREQS
jgi:hypothetical protein